MRQQQATFYSSVSSLHVAAGSQANNKNLPVCKADFESAVKEQFWKHNGLHVSLNPRRHKILPSSGYAVMLRAVSRINWGEGFAVPNSKPRN